MNTRFSRRLFFKKAGKVAGAAAVASVLPLPEPAVQAKQPAPLPALQPLSAYRTIPGVVSLSTCNVGSIDISCLLMSPPAIQRVPDDGDEADDDFEEWDGDDFEQWAGYR